MTTADLIMFSVVGVSAFAAARCPAPLILLAWWVLGMATWALTGGNIPVTVFLVYDLAAAALLVRFAWSWWDFAAAALFLPTWIAYLVLDGMHLWWLTWGVGLTQFILADIGSLKWSIAAQIERRKEARLSLFDDVFRRFLRLVRVA